MTKYNAYLERCAVEHLDISKDDHILEVGFGPGLGLEHVLNKGKPLLFPSLNWNVTRKP